jgi:hypothetical protein
MNDADAWTWWQSRRLRYNVALAAAGWLAYAAALLLALGFGHQVWPTWQIGLSTTLTLGTAFLVVMGVANICYLAGPALEAWLHPAEPAAFRKSAFALGFWGSVAAPFLFPTLLLARLLSGGP